MIRKFILGSIFFCMQVSSVAQQVYVDSLKREIAHSRNDTVRLLLLIRVANVYSETNPDSAYYYAEKMQGVARQLELQLEEIVAMGEMGYALLNLGNYPRSLQMLLSAIALAKDPKTEKNILPVAFPTTDDFTDRSVSPRKQRTAKLARIMQYAGILYGNSGNYNKAIAYFKEAIPYAESSDNLRILSITYTTLGRTYFSIRKNDSALLCLQKAYEYAVEGNYERYLGSIFLNMGRVYTAMRQQEEAKQYYNKALHESLAHQYFRGVVASNLALADEFKKSGTVDSALFYLRNGLAVASGLNAPDLFLRTYTSLAEFYRKTGNNDSLVKYQSLIIRINDSLFNSKQVQQFQNIDFDAQQRQLEAEASEKEYRNRLQRYLMLAGLAIFMMSAVFLLRINRQRKKTNATLQRKNDEIEIAMASLKSTQAQLIQAEKMASLGELTAGIAHEIQNPLNFVNNFSEINTELAEEIEEAIDKGDMEEIRSLAADIRSNQEKIREHGKRADSIVKGMLQHSRTSSGQKEPTDINALCEEYLRLAYHGIRAKEKAFNAKLETDFDTGLPKVNVIPQEIGRVVLNLLNNAFYAVHEKAKSAGPNYQPSVIISTRLQNEESANPQSDSAIIVRVADNGNGIPDSIKAKIFQPFFTTKPTGQGTGLGLSLSYDIVTKGHHGSLEFATPEEGGAEFIIRIPSGKTDENNM